MNILLWVLQVLLALHTLAGAFWKFSNPAEAAVPSLAALPPHIWNGISVLEIFASIALVLPVLKKNTFSRFPIYGAEFIAFVMILYCVVHFLSGLGDIGQPIYWIIVAAVASFISYGRMKLKSH